MIEIKLSLAPASGVDLYKEIQTRGQYEPEVFALLFSLLEGRKRAAFLNIGSNIGLFSLAAAKLSAANNEVTVYAHEPLPMLQEISRALMKANEVSYTLRHEALSDVPGKAEFYVSAKSDASNSLVKGFRPAKEVLNVDVQTLDGLYVDALTATPFDQIVLMVDVETAEPAVLRGGSRVLSELRPIVICEVLAKRTEVPLAEIFAGHRYVGYRCTGESWLRDSNIEGDATYKHRDWLFVPEERAEEFSACYVPRPARSISFDV